jgi:hypothetical protein
MGFDAYYLPNDNDQARDLLYGEDPVKKFNTAFPLEMYLANATEYSGEREFFSKFGLEIKNNVNVILSKRSFGQRVPQNSFTRPREGDLVYVPFLNGTGELFEIKFVNQTADFFQLGRKYPFFYEIELEKFKYSHEIISTGIQDIDDVVTDNSYNMTLSVGIGHGDYNINEIVFQSADGTQANASVVAVVQSWNAPVKQLVVSNIAGEFQDGVYAKGADSTASWTITTFDPLNVRLNTDTYDNNYIEGQANSIIDFSESNPFGNL